MTDIEAAAERYKLWKMCQYQYAAEKNPRQALQDDLKTLADYAIKSLAAGPVHSQSHGVQAMTKQERDELRAAEAKMTPGEWAVGTSGNQLHVIEKKTGNWIADCDRHSTGRDSENVSGIAIIRNRIVALLDHADAAEKVIRRLIGSLKHQELCGVCAESWDDCSGGKDARSAVADAEKMIGGGT